jgi:hypothetical protein
MSGWPFSEASACEMYKWTLSQTRWDRRSATATSQAADTCAGMGAEAERRARAMHHAWKVVLMGKQESMNASVSVGIPESASSACENMGAICMAARAVSWIVDLSAKAFLA